MPYVYSKTRNSRIPRKSQNELLLCKKHIRISYNNHLYRHPGPGPFSNRYCEGYVNCTPDSLVNLQAYKCIYTPPRLSWGFTMLINLVVPRYPRFPRFPRFRICPMSNRKHGTLGFLGNLGTQFFAIAKLSEITHSEVSAIS